MGDPTNAARRARYYAKNKDKHYEGIKALRQKKLAYIREYKTGKPCLDCGVLYPPYVLDFDHPPGEKDFAIAKQGHQVSWQRLDEEMEKCDLICSNCHRLRTFAEERDSGWHGGDALAV